MRVLVQRCRLRPPELKHFVPEQLIPGEDTAVQVGAVTLVKVAAKCGAKKTGG